MIRLHSDNKKAAADLVETPTLQRELQRFINFQCKQNHRPKIWDCILGIWLFLLTVATALFWYRSF